MNVSMLPVERFQLICPFCSKFSVDKEELREVNISKKELNDLVDELFSNLSDVDFDEVRGKLLPQQKFLQSNAPSFR